MKKNTGFLFMILIFMGIGFLGAYTVDFEGAGETKGAYASGTVNLSGLDWDMTESLIGTLAADWKNGLRSARMRGYAASSMTMLADKSNGIGSVIFSYRRYGTDAQVDWKVEYSTDAGTTWTQLGSSFTAPASDIVQTFSEALNITGNARIRIKRATETGVSNNRLNIDDITLTDYTGTGNLPPSITNIIRTPSGDVQSTTTVSASADVTDSDGTVSLVQLKWGTTSGSYPNTITMNLGTAPTYTTASNIPAQANGTTVYYVIYAEDDDLDSTTSSQQSYVVRDPAITLLPYNETFDTDLGDCYSYTVSGIKPWYYYSQSATANGYNGTPPEEQWLVLPGVNFNSYSNERMTFTTYVRYGTIDANNYLKLFYSTDYPGMGSPVGYTWTEIAFNQPTTGVVGSTELSANSGLLDLSSIAGTNVYLAFKYYSTDAPSAWRVDDISIYESTAMIIVSPSELTGFTYVFGNGPSAEQTFTVSGAELSANISISAPTNYEISLSSGTGYTSPLTLTQAGGTVPETTVYVRLKAGLAIASYNNEDITLTSSGAAPKTVTCSGSVTDVQPAVTVILRPTHIDISTETSESAVLVNLSNYTTDDVRYRVYNGSFQYNCWNEYNDTYVTSNVYAEGPAAPGTATTSSTFWIMSQRGGNISTAASYRDRLGPTYSPDNHLTVALPAAAEITVPFSLSGVFYGDTTYPLTNKYVVLAYAGTTLISAASTALTTGELAVVCPTGTTIDLIEIRDNLNNLVESKTGSWSTTTNVGGFGTSTGYYDAVAGLEGAALKAGLHTLIKDTHTTQFSYENTTDQLRYVDEDPLDSNNIIQIYTGWSIPKTAYGIGDTDWNKEHVWAKSHGNFGDTAPAGTDLHHLRPCDSTVNVAKSNRDFSFGTTPYVDSTPYPGYDGDTGCSYDSYIWEPRDEDKGDVARMIFYMATRYEGTDTTYDLEVVDYVNTAPANEPFYGKLTNLLAWNLADPPDAWELRRNDRIQERQGNRNPFIDHPEWITSIWGSPEPPDHVTNFAAGTPTDTTIPLTWTDATAEGYLIKGSSVSFAAITAPEDGTPEADGLLVKNVAQGAQTYTFTGLSEGTAYYFKIYPYNFGGDYILYKTDGTVPQVTANTTTSSPVLLEENFNYVAGTYLHDNGWTAHSGAGTNPPIVGTPGLTYTSYPSISGNCGETVNNGEDVHRTFINQTTGSVYVSFLINVTSATETGDYVFHLGPNPIGTDFKAKFFVGRDATNNVRFGLTKSANVGTAVDWTGYNYAYDTTYLVVLKYTIVEGAINDIVVGWINPVFSGAEPTPMLSAIVTETDIGSAGVAAVAIRQSNAALTAKFDGIRVATSWENLFPSYTGEIYVEEAITPFSSVVGTPSTAQTYYVSGIDLGNFIDVNVTGPFEVMDTMHPFPSWETYLQLAPDYDGNIDVRYNPTEAGTQYGAITHSVDGGEAANVIINLEGTATPAVPVITATPETMNFSTNSGTTSAAQMATVEAYNLSAGITIASTGEYEFSATEGGTYSNPYVITTGYNGTNNFWIRFAPTSIGTFYDTITLTSGTTSDQIDVTGVGLDPSSIFATDLFFSEYIEGGSNNKALEIFNGTGAPVDLSDYRVELYSNGSATFGNNLVMSGILAHNDVYVIANPSAIQAILDEADVTSTVTYFNGDDALAIYKLSTSSYVDIFGVIGDDPGTAWTGDGGYSTLDKTLVRKSFVTGGVTVNPTGTGPTAFTTLTTEWDLYPIDTYSDLGSHTFLPGLTPAAAPEFSVPAGVVTAPFMLSLTTTTPGGQIRYTTNGDDPTETSTLYSAPFQISATTTVKARTYADGYSPSAISIATYIFPTEVPNLLALRALTPGTGEYYKVTGEVVLTFQQSTRHQKYIQDATAAVLIDDAAGVITTTYNLYDGITGVCGTLTVYNGLLQFVPATDPGAATSINNEVIPEERTLVSLTSADQAKLIKVLNVDLDYLSGNFTSYAQNINATDPTATRVLRTFPNTDYSNTPIPNYTVDIICLVGQFNADMQISPRFLSDFSPSGGAPDAPTNVEISVSGNDIVINWNPDPAVTSWIVYSSDDPYTGFGNPVTVYTNSCTLTGQASTYGKRFYYVTANN